MLVNIPSPAKKQISTSFVNQAQLKYVLQLFEKLTHNKKFINVDGPPSTINILSMYKASATALQVMLDSEGLARQTKQLAKGVRAKRVRNLTIDSARGSKATLLIIIFSRTGSVGYCGDPNSLDAALTRSRL